MLIYLKIKKPLPAQINMKRKIKKWTIRLTATALLIATLLLVIILNPILTYANKTTHNNYNIYHNQPLNNIFPEELDHATTLVKSSEFYDSNLKLDICLNDGSVYPKLMRTLRGQAFAWGFYDKVVLQGTADYKNNTVKLNGYKWNLTQLLAHEMTHCLQYHKLGFWKSKPIAKIPNWKWEGYAEYVARQAGDQKNLANNIRRLTASENNDSKSWEIILADKTISPREYYNDWLLVQYCMDIKKMNYRQLLSDTTQEENIREEMFTWYNTKHN